MTKKQIMGAVSGRQLLAALISLTALGIGIVACGGDEDTVSVTHGTVISGVTVVNTRDGSLSVDRAIVVDAGRIVQIVPSHQVRASGTAQVVDGSGKYAVPGFVDMHVHAMVHADESVSYFPLMLASGITSFREMGAFPGQYPTMVARAKQLNADIAAGHVDAPRVVLVPSDIYQLATSASDAASAVDAQKALGVDFIKVISANRDAMLSFLAEAHAKGLYVAGHLTPAVSAAESSQLGWRSIEHLGSNMGILLDCSSDETATRQAIVAAAGASAPAFPSDATTLGHVLDTYSDDKCNALADTFVANGTWNVPTLRRVHALDETDDASFQRDPNMIYVDAARKTLWNNLLTAFAHQPQAARDAQRRLFARQQSTTLLLKNRGVKLMAGSDAGVASVWVIPGIGLHQEFRELVTAGLTPLEVLQMTTLNPAAFLGREATMGSVAIGSDADLVLLDGNPVQDVAALDAIAGVVLQGRYFSPDALAAMKAQTATTYATLSAAHFPIPEVEKTHAD